jgi:SAM-dependent methyltransferase
MSLNEALSEHLKAWGLRRFDTEEAYFRWQRETLAPADLTALNSLAEHKRTQADPAAERAFYDFTARPHILPVLYSQRYDYYLKVGTAVAERLREAGTVLDFGCGVGILTTFYAVRFPDRSFVGLDRSQASIAVATDRARALGLDNIRFETGDAEQAALGGPYERYDLIIATHALLQAEHDPGIPSLSWRTFERRRDAAAQADFESRTRLGPRVDSLVRAMHRGARFIVFEKTRQLARRVPFQRALAARGLGLLEPPLPLRYRLVDEVMDDGPLYVLSNDPHVARLDWDESPETIQEEPSARAQDPATTPRYENHSPSAQEAWMSLPHRVVQREATYEEPDGRERHIELGTSEGLVYLYWANTFDQRQLVVVEPERKALLESYYEESVGGA